MVKMRLVAVGWKLMVTLEQWHVAALSRSRWHLVATTKKELRRWKVMVEADEESSEELLLEGTRLWQEWSKLEEKGLDTWWRRQIDKGMRIEQRIEEEEKMQIKRLERRQI